MKIIYDGKIRLDEASEARPQILHLPRFCHHRRSLTNYLEAFARFDAILWHIISTHLFASGIFAVPWPLHSFLPAHAFLSVLQPLMPLHSFLPLQEPLATFMHIARSSLDIALN